MITSLNVSFLPPYCSIPEIVSEQGLPGPFGCGQYRHKKNAQHPLRSKIVILLFFIIVLLLIKLKNNNECRTSLRQAGVEIFCFSLRYSSFFSSYIYSKTHSKGYEHMIALNAPLRIILMQPFADKGYFSAKALRTPEQCRPDSCGFRLKITENCTITAVTGNLF
jgi:hypothetical protein